MADELSELVDAPEERLEIEYKAWMEFTPKHRADIARHIAAISNYGGGHIVFGIHDDMTSCGTAPEGFVLDHTVVASISKKYLEPSVPCDVRVAKSSSGVEHPIIHVPPHGPTPVCTKANGPEIDGKVRGIVAGTYYLRKTGPESAAIVTAAEWRDVIRRCALHDRAAILAAVTAALADNAAARAAPAGRKQLEDWAAAADQEYLRQAGKTEFAAPIQDCRLQLSYAIEGENAEVLPTSSLLDTLRQVGNEVDTHVHSGWSLFHVFYVTGLTPGWHSIQGADAEEFLQSSGVTTDRSLGFDLWRVSPAGKATVIREFWEDTPDFRLKPRTIFNPLIMAATLAELVYHADAFASRFPAPQRVEFRCE